MSHVKFIPMNLTVTSEEGETTVGQMAVRLGLDLDQPCGGVGTCGKCRVLVRNAGSGPTSLELKSLSTEELDAGFRLACQCPVEDGIIVIFEGSPADGGGKLPGSSIGIRYRKKLVPTVRRQRVSLEMPGVREPGTSLSAILRGETGAADMRIPLSLLRNLPGIFAKDKTATAVFTDTRLIAVEDNEQENGVFGVAIDIGTTTLAVWLIDLVAGSVVDTLSELNPQTAFGADVLSRISFTQKRDGGLEILKRSVQSSLNRMIGTIAEKNGVSLENIYAATVAGNTCMEHVFLGIDSSSIGRSPFIPAAREFPPMEAASVELKINPGGEVVMIPNISGYVGGDITAGIEASGMTGSPGVTLFVDIGTNSEIVLGNKDFLLTCSAAAGPAFEGARIHHGMRAESGAVERVSFRNGEIDLDVIGGSPPIGICGSGLVDLIAEMLRFGLIDGGGKMADPSMEGLRRFISVSPQGMKVFRFHEAGGKSLGKDLFLTQKDVREVQLAKGAIATGIQVLLKRKGLNPENLDRVIVAGAFGSYLNSANAIAVGILPEISPGKIEYIGNSSIQGAFHALVSRKCYRFMERIAQRADYMELSSLSGFQERFLSNLHFHEKSSLAGGTGA